MRVKKGMGPKALWLISERLEEDGCAVYRRAPQMWRVDCALATWPCPSPLSSLGLILLICKMPVLSSATASPWTEESRNQRRQALRATAPSAQQGLRWGQPLLLQLPLQTFSSWEPHHLKEWGKPSGVYFYLTVEKAGLTNKYTYYVEKVNY